ncbi:MAG TPA: hypothetical protein VMB20_07315 [Candidatus Acidoferrum sp.]|nr:hypothetical protein [Candidatus Acidoferrum sp.]
MKLGMWIFGLANIATGAIDLIWGALDPAHQPLQAWGDRVPGAHIWAYAIGVVLVAGGAAVLSPRTRRAGAALVALVYLIVAIFWLPRLITAPAYLGQSPGVYVGVLAGICGELLVVFAALIINAGRVTPALRVAFGLCVVVFGLQHLLNLHNPNNTSMVPTWMPFGQVFWVVLTGTAFVLAGVAIVIHVADVLAARLLALMFLVFSVVTLIPFLVAAPHDEANWGGNLYELVVAASAWLYAEGRD